MGDVIDLNSHRSDEERAKVTVPRTYDDAVDAQLIKDNLAANGMPPFPERLGTKPLVVKCRMNFTVVQFTDGTYLFDTSGAGVEPDSDAMRRFLEQFTHVYFKRPGEEFVLHLGVYSKPGAPGRLRIYADHYKTWKERWWLIKTLYTAYKTITSMDTGRSWDD